MNKKKHKEFWYCFGPMLTFWHMQKYYGLLNFDPRQSFMDLRYPHTQTKIWPRPAINSRTYAMCTKTAHMLPTFSRQTRAVVHIFSNFILENLFCAFWRTWILTTCVSSFYKFANIHACAEFSTLIFFLFSTFSSEFRFLFSIFFST